MMIGGGCPGRRSPSARHGPRARAGRVAVRRLARDDVLLEVEHAARAHRVDALDADARQLALAARGEHLGEDERLHRDDVGVDRLRLLHHLAVLGERVRPAHHDDVRVDAEHLVAELLLEPRRDGEHDRQRRHAERDAEHRHAREHAEHRHEAEHGRQHEPADEQRDAGGVAGRDEHDPEAGDRRRERRQRQPEHQAIGLAAVEVAPADLRFVAHAGREPAPTALYAGFLAVCASM
ncbi:MAG: hypothetical protein KIT31_29230 [Deltaproteobacteria bacterium]|nr:hypothetical protein [Deltaproteobacteria bacterium]